MKVEFLKPGAGFGLGYHTGDTVDLDDTRAQELMEAGVVIPVRQQKAETAESKVKTEKAVKPK